MSRRISADAEAAIDAALAARNAGRGNDAIAMLQSALATHPHNGRLWQALGTVYRALENSAAAIAAFEQAAQYAPGDLKARYGIAQASLEAGRPATALFDRARLLAPADGSLLLGRAAAQLAQGLGAQAIADLDAILSANPLWVDGQMSLSRLRWQMGEGDAFADGFERALAANPQSPQLWFALIGLLVEVEAYAPARAAIARARDAIGTSDALTTLDAACASDLGELAQADALFATLGAASAINAIEYRARHLLRRGNADAVSLLVEPHLDSPGGERLWPYLSLAWRITGDPRAAWLDELGFVGVYDLPIADLIEPLAARLRTLHRAKAPPAGQSVRDGTQTDGPLFALEAPEIRRLRAAVLDAAHAHIAALGARDDAHPIRRHIGKAIRFAGAWSVRLNGAGHHSNHIHPQGWFSSALYVAVPPQAQMGPAPNGWLQLGEAPAGLAPGVPPYRVIEPKPGRLVLFPSMLWHGTAPINGGERLTVAFDIAAIG